MCNHLPVAQLLAQCPGYEVSEGIQTSMELMGEMTQGHKPTITQDSVWKTESTLHISERGNLIQRVSYMGGGRLRAHKKGNTGKTSR